MTPSARYDGLAEWYDDYAVAGSAAVGDALVELLGTSVGSLLDIGCGTGLLFERLVHAGWDVTGVDVSRDQLRLASVRARPMGVRVAEASAGDLPFSDESFDAACLARVLTDLDEPERGLREAARVVRRGGMVATVTFHPCFVGPTARLEADGSRRIFPGYRESGWAADGPGIGSGLRSKVGTRHITLGELMTGFSAAGLRIETVLEPGEEALPTLLGVRARV